MHNVTRCFLLGLVILGAGPYAHAETDSAATREDASPIALAAQINAADFARFDRTLSSDAFAGRKPGTPAEKRTIDWLIGQFTDMGLQPGNHVDWPVYGHGSATG